MAETAAAIATHDPTKELTDKLKSGMEALFSSDKYKEYLNFMSRFHNYSSRNIMLIQQQMPSATRVAGAKLWEFEFNRKVNADQEHASIKIYAPNASKIKKEMQKMDVETGAPLLDEDGKPIMEEVEVITRPRFVLVPVYDVSQTHGDPLPQLAEDLTGNVEHYEAFLETLKTVSPLPISFEPLPPGVDGYCHPGKKIDIREGMSEIQTISAIVHEISHAKLHDKNMMAKTDKPKPRDVQEIEAESVSYVVCQRFGIETAPNSFGYLAAWSSEDMKKLKASLDTIRKEANGLITAIDSNFQTICKERGLDPTKQEQPAASLGADGDTFTIYQLKPGMWDYRFEGLEALTQRGLAVDPANYAEVYRAPLSPDETLQGIFTRFNNDHPKDFTGHSLSVSDVVVLERNGKVTAHYVDLRDFAELASFVAPGLTPEQSAPALASKAPPSGLEAPEPPATDEPPDIPTNQQPIYKFSLETALQSDEIKAFHKSRALDAACGEAIDQAIIDNNYELHRYDLKAAARSVIAEYGADRVAWVLATTVQDQDWDGRLSNTNKAWAKGFDIPARPAHYLTTHLSVLDGFINRFREVEKEKPSLMGALADGEKKSKQQFGEKPEPGRDTPTTKRDKGGDAI